MHWRRSARLTKLVVRQFERPRNRDTAVVLDLSLPVRPSADDRQKVELAVSFAATLLTDLCRKGASRVYLALCNPGPMCFDGPASSGVLQGMLEHLATVEGYRDDLLPACWKSPCGEFPPIAKSCWQARGAIDLTNHERFPQLRSNPLLRERARHLRPIDVSSNRFRELFQYE